MDTGRTMACTIHQPSIDTNNQFLIIFQIFSLWAVSDEKFGGLSFSSQDVGEALAISGI